MKAGSKIKDLSESTLISRFAPQFSQNLPRGVMGIGDDCALLPALEGPAQEVISTDLLVEGVHFRMDWSSAEDLAHKALHVNLSDIAAMGATPRGVFLSLALHPDTYVDWVDRFMAALAQSCREAGCFVLGGDLTASPRDLVVNVAVTGTVKEGNPKLRSGARNGDLICVTGPLGDSGAGYRILKQAAPELAGSDQARKARCQTLIQKHLRPRAHLSEGQWLGTQKAVHSMMDVSDGIGADLPKLLAASQKGAELEINKIPLSAELNAECQAQAWNPTELALCSGEDYCLLLTIDPRSLGALSSGLRQHCGTELHVIGFVTDGLAGELSYTLAGKKISPSFKGFDHFSA